jgi:hypothetical protein
MKHTGERMGLILKDGHEICRTKNILMKPVAQGGTFCPSLFRKFSQLFLHFFFTLCFCRRQKKKSMEQINGCARNVLCLQSWRVVKNRCIDFKYPEDGRTYIIFILKTSEFDLGGKKN